MSSEGVARAICCECKKGADCFLGSYIDDKGDEYIGFVCSECLEEQRKRKEKEMTVKMTCPICGVQTDLTDEDVDLEKCVGVTAQCDDCRKKINVIKKWDAEDDKGSHKVVDAVDEYICPICEERVDGANFDDHRYWTNEHGESCNSWMCSNCAHLFNVTRDIPERVKFDNQDHVTDVSKKVMQWTKRVKYDAIGGKTPNARQFEVQVHGDYYELMVNDIETIHNEWIYIAKYATLEDAKEAAELMLEVLKKCRK